MKVVGKWCYSSTDLMHLPSKMGSAGICTMLIFNKNSKREEVSFRGTDWCMSESVSGQFLAYI